MEEKKIKIFLDSNIIDKAIEENNTNSWLIMNLIQARKFMPIVSVLTIIEVGDYFRNNYKRDYAWQVEEFIRNLPDVKIIDPKNIEEIKKIQKEFNLSEEDASLLSSADEADYFISLNRDFLKSKIKKPIILNPKEFLKQMKIGPITDFE